MIKKLHLLLALCFWLFTFAGFAQTYPVTISTQLTQPSPIYLSNYADATTINSPIKVQLVLNDLTITNRQIRLKCYFQGNGISLVTNDFVVGARPLYLEGGFPLQLTNLELAPYFEFQNMLGINPNQYAQALPEGVYTFAVEVYDFATGKKLSRKTSVTTIIFQNEPPFLNLPLKNASIMEQNIQNIVFSWTPRSINVSNVEYEFSLVEIWDNYTPVQNAFAYSPALYTTTTRSTTLQYSTTQPQLIPGKRYAWRIKAKAIFGAEEIGVFKNNGYSEIFSFNYEVSCTAPIAITTESVSQDKAKITWSGDVANYDYQVKYREKNANSNWYDLVTPRENLTIANLKPNATYEYTVGASCDIGKYVASSIYEFTTLANDEIAFVGCGIKPDPKDLANKTPLPNLFPNDVVTAGDFPIVVIKATGSNGSFTGEGYVTLPFLEQFKELIDAADALGGEKIDIGKFSRIRITFNNIGVNTDFKLISGEIIASYDPDWKGMADGDKILNDITGSDGKPIAGTIDYEVKSAVLNPDGSTTITGENGQVTVIKKSVYDQVYTDNTGQTVTIPANGSGSPTIETAAEGGKAIATNTNGMSSSGEVTQISSPDVTITFENGPNSKYAFDKQPAAGTEKLKATYETIPMPEGGVYKVHYKAVSDLNGSDVFIAEANFKNGKTKDDIVFKTNTGAKVDVKWISDTKAEITVNKTLNFSKGSIIATVKGGKEKDPKDATKTIEGKAEVAGKVNVWELTQKPVISITLLSVNGASIPNVKDAKEYLNEVYNTVGVKFDVTTQSVTIASLPNEIQCGNSDILNVYTDGQNDIKKQIESNSNFVYNNETYYVIYTGKPAQNNYKGFMPLGGQYAFVFDNSLNTTAHELGHGIFGLKHPFSIEADSGKTDLLMDYGGGKRLSHNDWEIIHSGGWKFYGFQKSSTGGLVGNSIIKYKFEEFEYKNPTVLEFLTAENEFYYQGYKITFLNKNVKFDKVNGVFYYNIGDERINIVVLFDKNTHLNPELFYKSVFDDMKANAVILSANNLITEKAYYEKSNYKIVEFNEAIPVENLAQLNDKIKNLDTATKNEIIALLEALPLNEVLEICQPSKCYDIFGKEYTISEWGEIIKLLENKKNKLGVDLTKLAVIDQLKEIKALLLNKKNDDKICRLILDEVRSKREVLEYPKTFRLEYLGNDSGREQFRIQLLENFKIDKVESIFTISCALNQNIKNSDNVAFDLSLESSSEKITIDNLSKGTSAAEALSNLIGKTVLVSSVAIPSIAVATEYFITAETYTAYLELLQTKNAKCIESMAVDLTLQLLVDRLVKDYDGEGVPFSYTSLGVSCSYAYMSNLTWKEACAAGAVVALGDNILKNLTSSKSESLSTTISDATLYCALGAGLHNVVSTNYIGAVKESVQWYYIKSLVNKPLDYAKKSIVAKFMVSRTENFISVNVLAKIINTTTDDLAVTIKKLEEFARSNKKIVSEGEEILVKEADDKIIAKFESGKWRAVQGVGNVAEDITNFYTIDRALQSKTLVEKFNLTQFASSATKDEVVAIHRYTLNNFELTISAYGGNYTAVQQSWMNLIKSGLVKLSLTNKFIGKVYRGSNLSQSNLQPFLDAWASKTKIIKIPPIQSTSKLESVADYFIFKFKDPSKIEVMFEIESKTGIYIDDISDYGKHLQPTRHIDDPVQEEVLLFDNMDFKINDISIKTKLDGVLRYTINMTEL
ncbi:fibronectin type III domain-containing protein [Flavobacterium sp. PL002]|uniref:fibronectin type III domain-containing protein n=1 Tax=Flavobacterium sp. PL002 TaxID=1897058 RepID=UPI001787F131|nr:fibronectin type III domain-containing protein [Flavobacterium sp. PL002]